MLRTLVHGLSFGHNIYLSILNLLTFLFPSFLSLLYLHTFQNKDELYRYIEFIVIIRHIQINVPHAGFDVHTPGCTSVLAVSDHTDPDPRFNL